VRRVWRALILLSLTSLAIPARGSETAESLFLRANDLFQEGINSPSAERAQKIQRAASLYEQLVNEKGVRNGYLYYNSANCYFHLGQVGKAILNYRRAEKLTPNYSDLKQNIKSALARRKDRIEKSQIRSIAQTLFFWHNLMSLRTKITLFSSLFSVIWILLLVKLFLRRPIVKWGVVVCIFVTVVFGVSAALDVYADRSVRFGVILSEATTPRKGPGESYAESFKEPLHEGTEFRLRDAQGEWFLVELDNGKLCWVISKHVELI